MRKVVVECEGTAFRLSAGSRRGASPRTMACGASAEAAAPLPCSLPYSAASAMSSALPKWLNMPVKRLRSGGR